MKIPVIVLLIAVTAANSAVCAEIKGKVTVSAVRKAPVKSSYSRGVFEPKIKETDISDNAVSSNIKVVVWAEPSNGKAAFVKPAEKPLTIDSPRVFISLVE